VHYIGRTGRAGAKGIAYTFFTAANARHAKELLPILVEARQPVNPELSPMVSSSRGGGGGLSSILGQTGYCLRSVQSET
jgi:ATP-dependent RNA helicase DDX5/DBP2